MENIEQDDITPSAEYIKGFNEGYIIAKYNPNFSKDSISNTNLSDRSMGFSKGVIQYEAEKKQARSIFYLSQDGRGKDFSDKNRDKNVDMDRE